jgi:hypothetical protein
MVGCRELEEGELAEARGEGGSINRRDGRESVERSTGKIERKGSGGRQIRKERTDSEIPRRRSGRYGKKAMICTGSGSEIELRDESSRDLEMQGRRTIIPRNEHVAHEKTRR